MLGTAVDQLLVDLVGDHDQVVTDGDVGQALQSLIGLHHAGGVAGGVDDQHAGLVGDEALQLLQVDLEVVLLPQLVADGDGAEEVGHVDVVEPHGIGDQDLVAGVQEGGHGGIGALAHADGHQDLVGGVVHVVVPLELVGDGLTQLRSTIVGSIEHIASADAVVGGVLDDLGGVEVGTADLHVDHVLPLLLHLVGTLHHDTDAGKRKHLHALSSFKHTDSPFLSVDVLLYHPSSFFLHFCFWRHYSAPKLYL